MKIHAAAWLICAAIFCARALYAEEAPRVEQSPAAASTIEGTGEILGLRIGMPMKEAREKMNALRDPNAPRDEREKIGTRIYWKMLETEYDWVMAWANRDRKITRLRAVFRPEKPKPFSEIGDLSRAVTNAPHAAAWNAQRDNIHFRITAFGSEGRAVRVSILAFDPTLPDPPATDDDPE
jgi:hypothetical protein